MREGAASMETTYFSIDAKRIVVCGGEKARQAAGGGGSTRYAVIPRRRAAAAPRQEGKILDFRAYQAAARTVPPEEESLEEERPRGQAPERRGRTREEGRPGLPLVLDLLATGAILGTAATAVLHFLAL